MHGRAFDARVRAAAEAGDTLVLPQSVKRELVDSDFLVLHSPDFGTYGHLIDEARRRIADGSLPEHLVRADQYIPAIVCELAENDGIQVVTADRKLRRIVRDLAERQGVDDRVRLRDPLTVL